MRSVMHEKGGCCYLCQELCPPGERRRAEEEHHVFGGTSNRKNSEKYGLKVYLCRQHHREGPQAAHSNAEMGNLLKRAAQQAFERAHTREEFMGIFGKNWL